MADNSYDAIVIGGGNKALVTAHVSAKIWKNAGGHI